MAVYWNSQEVVLPELPLRQVVEVEKVGFSVSKRVSKRAHDFVKYQPGILHMHNK
jgi:hypothetical protein